MDEKISDQNTWYLIFAAWVISCVSTIGGLFFSEIMQFTPCVLCWYQRIAMYPLTIIFLIGLFPLSKQVFKFSIAFVAIGWLLAVYHNLLHYKIVPESASPCRMGVSCSTVYINLLGFITIPLLSFMAFSLLGIILFVFYRRHIHEK